MRYLPTICVTLAWIFIGFLCVVAYRISADRYYLTLDRFSKTWLANTPVRSIHHDQKVTSFLERHPVYLSVSTTPLRIHKLHNILTALDSSNVSKIFVVLPKKFRNTQPYIVPSALTAIDKVKILWMDNDIGPLSKSYPVINHVALHDTKAIIVTIDDDYFYPKGLINEHISALVHRPMKLSGLVLATLGAQASNPPVHYQIAKTILDRFGYMHRPWLLHGVGSIGFMLNKPLAKRLVAMLDEVRLATKKTCLFEDDVLLTYALERSGYSPWLIHNQFASHQLLKPYWTNQYHQAISDQAVDVFGWCFARWLPSWYHNHSRIQACMADIASLRQTVVK